MFLTVNKDKVLIDQRLVGYLCEEGFFMNCECMLRDPDMWFLLQVQKQIYDRAFKTHHLKRVEVYGTNLSVYIDDFDAIDHEIIETDELFDDYFDESDGEIIWSEMCFAENCIIGRNRQSTGDYIETSIGYDYRPGKDIILRYHTGCDEWEEDGYCWWRDDPSHDESSG